MYSAVLMMALTAGTDSVDFGRRGGCSGCYGGGYGCSGAVVSYGCSGSYGCNGGGCHGGGRGGLFRRGGRGGCCGGGGYYGGCTGVAYHGGCTGGAYYGGCTGGVYHGGCTGGIHHGGVYHGGCTGGVYHGGCTGGVIYPQAVPGVAPKTMPAPETAPLPKKSVQTSAPANIVVSLPANASLTFDGAATSSTSDRRSFVTPTLEVGTTYAYTLRATVDGVEQTQQVRVRAGETSVVNFSFPQSVANR